MEKNYTNLFYRGISSIVVLCLAFNAAFARESAQPLSLGTVKEFKSSISRSSPVAKTSYALRLESNRTVNINISINECKKNDCYVFGTVQGHEEATFFVRGDAKNLEGYVIFRKTKEAYKVYTEAGMVLIARVDINTVICIGYDEYKEEPLSDNDVKAGNTASSKGIETMVAPLLNSLPTATATLYLDFDGENVTGSNWGNINAAASSFSNANITTIWTAVSEDYSPFNVNVTTDRAVFNAAPANKRMMAIFTPTNTAAPGAGGVAYLNSWGSGEPCWVFNNSVKSAEEAASHELGHTMGLSHDGTSSQEYFAGHGTWGPIMGAVYTRAIVQWSKGEYTDASQTQQDVTIISNKLQYRVDDAGNTPATSKPMVISGTGSVASSSNFGVIEKNTDVDVFGFITTGGSVTFSIIAKTEAGSASVPDLNIQARILDNTGAQVALVSPTGVLTAAVAVNQNLAAGTYYLEIDGVGEGSALSGGYSDYGSLGQYFISGNVPGGTSTGASINDDPNTHAINVFPNPSSGIFTINIPLEGNNESSIELLNSLGQAVMSSSENTSGNIFRQIDLTGNPAGIYYIMVRSGNDVWKGKVILQ